MNCLKILLTLSLIVSTLPLIAQNDSINKLNIEDKNVYDRDVFAKRRILQSAYVVLPTIAGGLIVKSQDKRYRNLRNSYLPQFKNPYDNYIQLAPAAALLSMKLAGVPSRTSWGRMIATDVIATGIMASIVNLSKHTTNVMRPDGTSNNSFPSGHTATAFMAATMLDREYGHISPWITVSAYTMATATGLTRIANNRHWLSDVMVGAGVGIISTDMAYWIADAIFKNKGINKKVVRCEAEEVSFDDCPSFLGIYSGYNVPLSSFEIDKTHSIKTSSGTVMGIEGAYYINNWFGIGGRAAIHELRYILNGNIVDDNTIKLNTFSFGPYFSMPIIERLMLTNNFFAGRVRYKGGQIDNITYSKKTGYIKGVNLSVDYMVKPHFISSLFINYSTHSKRFFNRDKYIDFLTIGAKISVGF